MEQSTCVARCAIIGGSIDEFCQFSPRHAASRACDLVTLAVATFRVGNQSYSYLKLVFESDFLCSSPRRPGEYVRGITQEISRNANVLVDNFDHRRSDSSLVVCDGNDRPILLLSVVMRDTLRIGVSHRWSRENSKIDLHVVTLSVRECGRKLIIPQS